MPTNNLIDYIEFKAKNLGLIKTFYSTCFGWTFADYGPTYVAFESAGIQGGFETTTEEITNGVLVVLYHEDLIYIRHMIQEAGGKINIDIFSFPGGRRFHFIDPSGNELSIWSDKKL